MGEPLFDFEIDVSQSHYVAPDAIPPEIRTMLAPVILQSRDDGAFDCRGTSFCIVPPTRHAQAIYVTARHVVDSLAETRHANPYVLIPKATIGDGASHLVAVPIDAIFMTQSPNDLALIRIDLQKAHEPIESEIFGMAIALRPPEIGENTLAFGYPYQVVTDAFRFDSELRASHGLVEEVHDKTQDTFRRLTFPSFRVTGRYEGGMSGGPVYDEKAGVIGVVSRGMTPSNGTPPYGIAQSIGCLAELRAELMTDDGTPFEYSVPEMSQIGLIKLVDDYNVTFDRDDSGLRLRWS